MAETTREKSQADDGDIDDHEQDACYEEPTTTILVEELRAHLHIISNRRCYGHDYVGQSSTSERERRNGISESTISIYLGPNPEGLRRERTSVRPCLYFLVTNKHKPSLLTGITFPLRENDHVRLGKQGLKHIGEHASMQPQSSHCS